MKELLLVLFWSAPFMFLVALYYHIAHPQPEIGECYGLDGYIVKIVEVKQYGATYTICSGNECRLVYSTFNRFHGKERVDCP